MFERFTDEARRVVVQAQEESRELNHSYIGTEHLLLGVLREDGGVAAEALASLEVGLDPAREQVAEITGRGQQAPSGHIPFTPRAKKVLELSLREALRLGHPYIGPEHILLGLISEGHGVAVEVLRVLGAPPEQVQARVLELVPPAGEGPSGADRPVRVVRAPVRLDEALRRLDAIEARLATTEARLDAIEQRLGLGEPPAAAGPG
jgi:ATP-dependent Clp protease ATP-binding subunit ClpC